MLSTHHYAMRPSRYPRPQIFVVHQIRDLLSWRKLGDRGAGYRRPMIKWTGGRIAQIIWYSIRSMAGLYIRQYFAYHYKGFDSRNVQVVSVSAVKMRQKKCNHHFQATLLFNHSPVSYRPPSPPSNVSLGFPWLAPWGSGSTCQHCPPPVSSQLIHVFQGLSPPPQLRVVSLRSVL